MGASMSVFRLSTNQLEARIRKTAIDNKLVIFTDRART